MLAVSEGSFLCRRGMQLSSETSITTRPWLDPHLPLKFYFFHSGEASEVLLCLPMSLSIGLPELLRLEQQREGSSSSHWSYGPISSAMIWRKPQMWLITISKQKMLYRFGYRTEQATEIDSFSWYLTLRKQFKVSSNLQFLWARIQLK